MKILCSVLIAVVAFHAECRVLCFAEHAGAQPQPACHENSKLPAPEHPPHGDDGNSCGQAPGIDSRIISIVKCELEPAALEPVAPVVLIHETLAGIFPIFSERSQASLPPLRSSVLRI